MERGKGDPQKSGIASSETKVSTNGVRTKEIQASAKRLKENSKTKGRSTRKDNRIDTGDKYKKKHTKKKNTKSTTISSRKESGDDDDDDNRETNKGGIQDDEVSDQETTPYGGVGCVLM